MAKMIVFWLALSFSIGLVIVFWQEATSKDRWALTKTVSFAILCASIATVLLSFLVLLF